MLFAIQAPRSFGTWCLQSWHVWSDLFLRFLLFHETRSTTTPRAESSGTRHQSWSAPYRPSLPTMADAPSTPAAGAVPASPKLLLPPMTVSPGVTRLDRVLDLVTDHEAQFRDHELRVVDLSARVAAVERAVGGTEARSVAFADGTPYGAYPDGEHPNDETPPDLRSEMATTKASVADLRFEFAELAEALREVRSEMRSLVDDAKAQKAGFKRVLRMSWTASRSWIRCGATRHSVTDDGERGAKRRLFRERRSKNERRRRILRRILRLRRRARRAPPARLAGGDGAERAGAAAVAV